MSRPPRTKRRRGPLPEAVTRALDRLARLGEPDLARAALAALGPGKPGRPRVLGDGDHHRIAMAYRARWREDPDLSVHQVAKALARGTVEASPNTIKRGLAAYCASLGTTVDGWEAAEKGVLTHV